MQLLNIVSPTKPSFSTFSLVGTGNIDKAAIFNAEGTSTWAASPHLKVRHMALLLHLEREERTT